MELETQSPDLTEIFESFSPEHSHSLYSVGKASPAETLLLADAHRSYCFESVLQDDKAKFLSHAKRHFTGEDAQSARSTALKLLNFCCGYDSVNCASSVINGELEVVPYINEFEATTGLSPLHAAAEAHASRCVEMLLKRRARIDVRSKDGRALLPLELSLQSRSLDVTWNPSDNNVEDLIVLLSQKDLTVVKLLAEKTKLLNTVACENAICGQIVPLATLLIVAADKINRAMAALQDTDLVSEPKTTIYESVVREALSEMKGECNLKRMLLLREIELLQLFGVVAFSCYVDKKLMSPLFATIQAGDEVVLELLLETDIDVNEKDAEGNTALHCCLKASSAQHMQQIRMMSLLIEYGARVGQKNKLGLSALHFAAANGNVGAVEILLWENPDAVNFKTEIKETPLFFAVKNNHLACVELLLRWGANTEVRNLRKQRPVDLAESQDMRFMLNPTNISSYSQARQATALPRLSSAFSRKLEEESISKRCSSPAKVAAICKYNESPAGCFQGPKCFYGHGEDELRQTPLLKRKVFVRGLPPSLDSDSLGRFFEESFGSVEGAMIMGIQAGDHIQSQGCGFVTFNNEENFSEAVQANHINILGKRVEIKAAVHNSLLLEEIQKLKCQRHREEKRSDDHSQSPPDTKREPKFKKPSWVDMLFHDHSQTPPNTKQEPKSKKPSWVEMLFHDLATTSSSSSNKPSSSSTSQVQGFNDKSTPIWLKRFVNWLPRFLQDAPNHGRETGYPLSSLKVDFRAIFRMELDHSSLGYQKLSDFIKSFPNLCQTKVVPIGKSGIATHWVLLPTRSKFNGKPPQPLKISHNTKNNISNDSATSSRDLRFSNNFIQDGYLSEIPEVESPNNAQSSGHQQRHPVLETLARKRNNTSVFFLREFDFYRSYEASIRQGKCFWCNETRLLWANFPCQHKLWCFRCKQEAAHAAGGYDHRCVICDARVKRLILAPANGFNHPRLANLLSNNNVPFLPALRKQLLEEAITRDCVEDMHNGISSVRPNQEPRKMGSISED